MQQSEPGAICFDGKYRAAKTRAAGGEGSVQRLSGRDQWGIWIATICHTSVKSFEHRESRAIRVEHENSPGTGIVSLRCSVKPVSESNHRSLRRKAVNVICKMTQDRE